MSHVLPHVPAGNGSEVIVGEYAAQGPGREAAVHAKRLNVNDGAVTSLSYGAPPDVRQWMFDDKGDRASSSPAPRGALPTTGATLPAANGGYWPLLMPTVRRGRRTTWTAVAACL